MKENNLLAELAAYLFAHSDTKTGRTPSERELAEQFSVSRGQIREALAILEAMRRNSVDIPSLARQHERLAEQYRLGGVVMRELLDKVVAPVRPTETRPESETLLMLRAADFPEPNDGWRASQG